jgi:hypothetical protein
VDKWREHEVVGQQEPDQPLQPDQGHGLGGVAEQSGQPEQADAPPTASPVHHRQPDSGSGGSSA